MVSTFRFLVLFYNSQKLPGRCKEPPSYQCEQGWQLVSQLKIKEGIIYTDLNILFVTENRCICYPFLSQFTVV